MVVVTVEILAAVIAGILEVVIVVVLVAVMDEIWTGFGQQRLSSSVEMLAAVTVEILAVAVAEVAPPFAEWGAVTAEIVPTANGSMRTRIAPHVLLSWAQ